MDPADRDRVLIADFAAERARLGEANMMRFGRHSTADDARLRGDELAVLLPAMTLTRESAPTANPNAHPLVNQSEAA